jgi:hypothetical protein
MIMSLRVSMEQSNEYFGVSNKATDDERIWKIIAWHSVVVKA